MKVLFCSYEVAPFFKKGGLGDVAGSLPKALANLGVDISVVMPDYDEVKSQKLKVKSQDQELKIKFAGREEIVRVDESVLPGSEVPIFFLENERYLSELKEDRNENMEQFGFFSKAIAKFSQEHENIGFDLVHLNDWHTALVPLLLKLPKEKWEVGSGKWERPATLLTVHNFGHQGKAPLDLLNKLGIRQEDSKVLAWDTADNDLEMLMEGIIHADLVNTVSPTYAKEIMESKVAGRLSEVLKGKEGRVKGILNGIDYSVWNPETDKYLAVNYGLSAKRKAQSAKLQLKTKNWREGKRKNKLALQEKLGLETNGEMPLLAFVGRLASKQKGLEILYSAMIKLFKKAKFQFVLLGKGSQEWEEKFKKLATKEKQVATVIRFDEGLAHQIYAGADFVLIPSQFEPCGLVQQIGMRYGALPIVRKTGGLADTVKDGINGFVFEEYRTEALIDCLKRGLQIFNFQFSILNSMVERAIGENFSWKRSAKEYLKLYQKAIEIWKER